jgi:hypothetical protein
VFADYKDGAVIPVKCLRRGARMLPIVGVYAHVIRALERNMDSVMILEDAVNALIRIDGCDPKEAFLRVSEALESLLVEGWIKPKALAGRPFIKV